MLRTSVLATYFMFPLSIFAENGTAWPTAGWDVATPEETGFDSGKLAVALIEIRARKLNIHSLLLVRHDRVVVDAKFYPYDGNVPTISPPSPKAS
jgi:hypothetical protein